MSAIVEEGVDPKKRRLLTIATAAVGAAGAASVAVPFLFSMKPSARALAAGAAVEVDLSLVELGQQVTVEWRGAPVWILHRTPEMIAQLEKNDGFLADPQSAASKQPEYAKNAHRSRDPKFLVVKGVCTHLGCSPTKRSEIGAAAGDLGADWPGGYFCPCHQSKFDLSGRVFKGMPAPTNLEIPPYAIAGTRLVVGDDKA
ncbi:MAG: ubiquinol-cytochrome c reductase iron-sulfur subunit [Burkholderiales bacterium]|nr:ubiquinol-cytochrome c reductase iron-sulfur subunit [Burkholderiales bacterium]